MKYGRRFYSLAKDVFKAESFFVSIIMFGKGPLDFRYEICDKCGKLKKN